ncbi:putative E3 ubiquitin-protein ligase HECTD2, partial [Trichonephila clavata]
MKQDLEKTETVYFSNFLSKKKLSKVPRNVNTVPGGTTATPADPSGKTEYQKKDEENKLVETINVRFDECKKGIDFKPKTNGYPRLDLNFPDYDDEEDDFDTVRDSLASRLVSKTSTETPTTSFEKPDLSSDNRSLIPCSEVKWIRNIGREVTGSKVYYGIEGTATRLRSFNEIERYCNKSNIQYDPSLFDFRKEDTESQEVNMVEVDIPNSYKQAIRSREASKWHDAMDREINIMKERKDDSGSRQIVQVTGFGPLITDTLGVIHTYITGLLLPPSSPESHPVYVSLPPISQGGEGQLVTLRGEPRQQAYVAPPGARSPLLSPAASKAPLLDDLEPALILYPTKETSLRQLREDMEEAKITGDYSRLQEFYETTFGSLLDICATFK